MAKKTGKQPHRSEKDDPEGYPSYPKSEDIYSKLKEEENIDPITRKEKPRDPDPFNVKRGYEPVDENLMGSDLDVPGAELDDDREEIGAEDEENNYYSIGGDKDLEEEHDDLEELEKEVDED